MAKRRILLMLDVDPQPSVFDGVVAVDAEVDFLFRHGAVDPGAVRDLVYGAMFTRGGDDLRQTAIFIGGSNAAAAEAVLEATKACFFGPVRVSVMVDPNGANTTAAAAIYAAAGHVDLGQSTVTVLAATGPVGRRVVRLAVRQGARVRVCSRDAGRASAVCDDVSATFGEAELTAWATASPDATHAAVEGANIVVAAGGAGVELLSEETRRATSALRVAIDLNAVPPLGVGGLEVHDKAVERHGCLCYGAVGVGGTKMKIHKAALKRLFERNDHVLDAEQIYEIAASL